MSGHKSGRKASTARSGRKVSTATATSVTPPIRTMQPSHQDLTKKPSDEYMVKLMAGIAKHLMSRTYYHGCMPREECETLLVEEGDFLVRLATREDGNKKEQDFVISLAHNGKIVHVLIKFIGNGWMVDKLKSESISGLIERLRDTKHQLPSGGVLITAKDRPSHYILHANVTREKKLGEGNFGEVYKGTVKLDAKTERTCAIKICKGNVTKKQIQEFMKEAGIMRRFDHPNIVRYYGVAAQEPPLMLLMEFCDNGVLKAYCTQNATKITEKNLLDWVTDGARGMCYLHRNKVLHRDLAARNCLVGGECELKIADFGKSEGDTTDFKVAKVKNLPVKWSPPEVFLEGHFSTKSDVWSFGVMAWEIFMRCTSEPYPNKPNHEIQGVIKAKGCTLETPPRCPAVGEEVMKLCWKYNKEARPEFDVILKLLAPNEEPPKADSSSK